MLLAGEEKERTSSTARSSPKSMDSLRLTGRRKRNSAAFGQLQALRENRADSCQRGAMHHHRRFRGPSGALVIEAKNIGKAYGGRAIVTISRSAFSAATASASSAERQRQDHAHRMLTGILEPDTGTVKLAQTSPSPAQPASRHLVRM